jgi:hypothetical protein
MAQSARGGDDAMTPILYPYQRRYLWQVGGGPAIGIYQHERRTVRDVARYMERSRTLENVAGLFYADIPDVPSNIALQWQIATNLSLATVYARAHYWRVSEALPAVDDIVGLAAYAKRHWNTSAGKATVDDYAQAYRCYFKTGTGDLAYL